MSVRDRAPASASRGGDFWSTLRETIVLAATLASFLASAWLLRRPAPAPIQIVPPPTPAPTLTPTPKWIQVYLTGAVRAPGVYTVPQGVRIWTLLEQAGGAQADADLEALNLAAPVADGMHLHVPRRGEPPSATPTPSARLNLNTASVEALEQLPGIGPRTAQAIVDHRLKHGPFRRLEDLLAIPGIGPATLERIRPWVTIDPEP
ncbi:ComEA family DNA-binding protein [Thermoflexus sp.]|uniref:ComEA family DNA-binding protein n=1 Tax=Thermoflexus sp. TaxID=1969742 RepID=UPI0017738E74|nr:ComEA family DNA-binding protein [Thermoflexus sp.]